MFQRIALVVGLLLCSFGAFGAQEEDQKFVDYKLRVGDRLIGIAGQYTMREGNYPHFVDARSGKTFAALGFKDADYRKLQAGAVVRIPVEMLNERGMALLPAQQNVGCHDGTGRQVDCERCVMKVALPVATPNLILPVSFTQAAEVSGARARTDGQTALTALTCFSLNFLLIAVFLHRFLPWPPEHLSAARAGDREILLE